jgi:hypothetical protein
MFRKYIQSLVKEEVAKTDTRKGPEIVPALKDSAWFKEHLQIYVAKAMANELRLYREEIVKDSERFAKRAVAFVNEEAFLDSVIERITRKQLK